MKIQVKTRDLPTTDPLRGFLYRRARLAFGRLSARIERVEITVAGGPVPRCRVDVRGRGPWRVVVEAEDVALGGAVRAALGRASRGVARRIDRQLSMLTAA